MLNTISQEKRTIIIKQQTQEHCMGQESGSLFRRRNKIQKYHCKSIIGCSPQTFKSEAVTAPIGCPIGPVGIFMFETGRPNTPKSKGQV